MARGEHPIHSELGRENPQRQWYCVLRRGRVGRCQAKKVSFFDVYRCHFLRNLSISLEPLILTRGGAAR